MKLTNGEIYNINSILMDVFKEEDNTHYFSAKINFLIQKNKKNITDAAFAVEKVRLEIINKYKTENNTIPQDKIEEVNKELNDLLTIEQEVHIYKIPFEDLENIEFTSAQANALMFMIDDPKEEEEEETLQEN